MLVGPFVQTWDFGELLICYKYWMKCARSLGGESLFESTLLSSFLDNFESATANTSKLGALLNEYCTRSFALLERTHDKHNRISTTWQRVEQYMRSDHANPRGTLARSGTPLATCANGNAAWSIVVLLYTIRLLQGPGYGAKGLNWLQLSNEGHRFKKPSNLWRLYSYSPHEP